MKIQKTKISEKPLVWFSLICSVSIVLIILLCNDQKYFDAKWQVDGFIAWIMVAVIALLLLFCMITLIGQLFHFAKIKRSEKIKETGVWAFVELASSDYLEGIREAVFNSETVERKMWRLGRIPTPSVKNVSGIVCGEEIFGIANGPYLTVTVTRPETRKAFNMLPKKSRKYLSIVYKPEK